MCLAFVFSGFLEERYLALLCIQTQLDVVLFVDSPSKQRHSLAGGACVDVCLNRAVGAAARSNVGEMASIFLLAVPTRSPLDAFHEPVGPVVVHAGVVKSSSLKSSWNNPTCRVTGMLNWVAPKSFVVTTSTAL